MRTVRLRYKDEVSRCRFFEVAGDGPALLDILHKELLGMLKIIYEVVGVNKQIAHLTPRQ